MDQRLQQAIDFANYAKTLANQKKLALQNFKDNCIFYFNAGKFILSQEFISFVSLIKDEDIVLDANNIPVTIEDSDNFRQLVTEAYQKALFEYNEQYHSLTKQKNVQGLIDE